MRTIEHYRHAMRVQPEQHLSQAGVDFARRVGAGLGRFDRVVTSDAPRAIETAVAMGYAVNETVKRLTKMGKGVEDEVDWSQGCVAFAAAARLGGKTSRAVAKQAEVLRRVAESIPEDGKALVVSHGGIIEEGVVGLLPDLDYGGWGPAFGYCEGVRLLFEGGRCVAAVPLRGHT